MSNLIKELGLIKVKQSLSDALARHECDVALYLIEELDGDQAQLAFEYLPDEDYDKVRNHSRQMVSDKDSKFNISDSLFDDKLFVSQVSKISTYSELNHLYRQTGIEICKKMFPGNDPESNYRVICRCISNTINAWSLVAATEAIEDKVNEISQHLVESYL